ncbi:hypothetical protein [Sporocytophaga myxococcoides]|uniref:hypothetical protein n=1 Tax=Sporocytophaga myxococcoides TaxID=153721 RepID=UPI0003F51549|nr:hypothetical protein [Sporocytophaga myxococcoides]
MPNMDNVNYIRAEDRDEKSHFMKLKVVQDEICAQKGITRFEDLNPANFVGFTITHTFDDTQLPVEFDCVFLDDFKTEPFFTKATLSGCFNYKSKFHTKLWKGHSHHAIFEFENGGPDILNSLKFYGQKKRWDPNLIFCSKTDVSICRNFLKESKQEFEQYMKEHNPHIYEANKKEEEEFKRKLK